MYITIEEYSKLYDQLEDKVFNRLVVEACRVMDNHTTGVDGVKKLKAAFPTAEGDALAIKHCAAKIINLLHQIQEAEETAAVARGYTKTDQGLQRKIISRVESGNDAISYSETKLTNSTIDAAVADVSARKTLIANTVREYLSGVCDANGVNLLYMGEYPRRYVC